MTCDSETTTVPEQLLAKVGDSNFQEAVLTPRGIHINVGNRFVNSFYYHLNLDRLGLSNDRAVRFKTYQDAFKLNVWQNPTEKHAKEIKRDYIALFYREANEAEYKFYALTNILLAEPLFLNCSRADAPELEQLEPAPPILNRNIPAKHYEWDISPDCGYFISVKAFPSWYRFDASSFVLVHHNTAFSSYLTIAFQGCDEEHCKVVDRAAAASAIALVWSCGGNNLEGNAKLLMLPVPGPTKIPGTFTSGPEHATAMTTMAAAPVPCPPDRQLGDD
ncbi:hypothetical protein NPX13_g9079 [Xylaria arbuscula]|uniref:Uncharacterized protein n=1 Tax=Xylaria arbuscula TaxID=114810 RepID=A0A9W8N7I9_9PEZI|nr:hypothetical protein NPX13_g9079 [Xylaria arbuscula]